MINGNLNTKSRVTSWIATSVSPGWIRGSLLLDIRLLNMHYSSIVYSLCSSTFEATNYEKSNDKRLSAPAPFLICSTTCVWSLKSGGYGGEGRRLMSIYPTTILHPVFFFLRILSRNKEQRARSNEHDYNPSTHVLFFSSSEIAEGWNKKSDHHQTRNLGEFDASSKKWSLSICPTTFLQFHFCQLA